MNTLIQVFLTALALPGACAWAQTNTADIVANTLKAVPACSNYRVAGACFWLKCEAFPPHCRVISNVRISHFSPEVVVSTWHDAASHPWADYGRTVTKAVGGVASGLVGMATDSAGSRFSGERTDRNILYRDADAIGNPTSMIGLGNSASQNSAGVLAPAIPDESELRKFLRNPRVSNRSDTATAAASSDIEALRRGADIYTRGAAAVAQVRQTLASGAPTSTAPADSLARAAGFAAPAAASGLMCPSTSKGLMVHFHSYLDALVWRGIVPAELLYPSTYLPGVQEVGSSGLNTWGSLYPRVGAVTQQIPMKGAAVLAQRVANIISQSAQPHVYAALSSDSGYRYFGLGPVLPNDSKDSKWQRLYPHPSATCEVFGTNDALSLTTWGDGQSSSEEAYSWNLWRRLECCKVEGIFIGSIAF
ncbi:TraU family protein [Janthinobacterium sp. BJB446]|uniref:TraU family protein n=1 Tax=Janthinobacterium sp. BJB446 TaxID=2048009 RepID=UPI00117A82D9|nr:TraU family protein [Janthinobacterium sp. BJB446]